MKSSIDLLAASDVLRRAKELRALCNRYDVEALQSDDDFQGLPCMDKADLRRAFPEFEAQARARGRRAYVVSTGGTTGAPNLSLIPSHMFLTDIVKRWQPLGPQDVFCNIYPPGKLWGAHYFYNTLSEQLAGETIALGPLQPQEFDAWTGFLVERRVTAFGGVPTTLKQMLGLYDRRKAPLPPLRKILWVGEPCDADLVALMGKVLPNVETWGLYGSVQTWPIGYNFPRCPLDTFHVLPYQNVEIIDQQVVVTNTHPDCLNVLLRYRTGDAACWTDCACGDAAPAIRLLGRIDDSFNFRAVLISPSEFIQLATAIPGVTAAQLAVVTSRDERGDNDDLELRVVLAPEHGPALLEVRRALREYLRTRMGLNNVIVTDPDAVRVVAAQALATNPRTHKTPTVVRETKGKG